MMRRRPGSQGRRRNLPAGTMPEPESSRPEVIPNTEAPHSGSSSDSAMHAPSPVASLRGEWGNLLLLTGLYTLQGIPMGLASSVPLFLQARGASFADQATFGLASW